MSKSHLIKDYFRLFRVGNLLFIVVIQFLTLFCVIFPFTTEPAQILSSTMPSGISFSTAFLLLVFSTTLIAAAGNIINDVYDVDTDIVNRPQKVIIGQSVKSGTAVGIALALGIIGSLLGLWMSYRIGFWSVGLIFPLCAFGLWLYASRYKKTLFIGNLMVSLFCGITVIIVWLFSYLMFMRLGQNFIDLLQNLKIINFFVWGFSGFAFLTTLIREIVKDCEDINGDTFIGCRTFPILYGFDKTKTILFWLIFLLIVLLGVAQWFLFRSAWLIMGYWGFVIQFLLLRLTSKLQRAETKNEFHQLSKRMKIIMLIGVFSMIFIPVCLLI